MDVNLTFLTLTRVVNLPPRISQKYLLMEKLVFRWTERVERWIMFFGAARAVERFWRTIKYEDIYLKEYKDGKDLFDGLQSYVQFYNHERKHQSLLYLTPNQVFNERLPITKNNANLIKT